MIQPNLKKKLAKALSKSEAYLSMPKEGQLAFNDLLKKLSEEKIKKILRVLESGNDAIAALNKQEYPTTSGEKKLKQETDSLLLKSKKIIVSLESLNEKKQAAEESEKLLKKLNSM